MYVTTCTHHDVTHRQCTYRRRAAVTLLAVLLEAVAAHGTVVDGCGQIVKAVVEALVKRVGELLLRARRPMIRLVAAVSQQQDHKVVIIH